MQWIRLPRPHGEPELARGGSAPARTVTFTYAVGGNPLINRLTDTSWGASSVSATVDLLGRTVSYTDIWGDTTTTTFDQPGRQTTTAGPAGTLGWAYAAATGRHSTTSRNGTTLATNTYDAAGRLYSVAYGNGTGTLWGFDTYGRKSGIAVFDTGGTTGETRSYSLAGRVIDQQVFAGGAFVDAAAGANFTYDGGGRLTQASLPGVAYAYGYGTAAGCPATAAGKNTNRTSVTITGTGAGTTDTCYNQADQLVSTSSIPSAQVAYDDHGNTTQLGDMLLEYDATDRHVRTETPAAVTNYRRDPLDRLAERVDATRITHVASTTATAASTSASPTRPTGTQTGDLIIAAVSARGLTAPSALTAAGWTVAAERTNGVGRTWVLTRYATGTDPGSWAFTATGATHTTVSLSSYRNPNPTGVVATSATAVTTAASSHPVPAVTTTSDAAHVVHVTGLVGAVNPNAPGGTTQRARVNADASLLVTDRYQNRAGTPSAVSVTSDLAISTASITIALIPLTTVARYGYSGHTDSHQWVRNSAATIVETLVGLPGNTTHVIRATGGNLYSHANQHGDTVTITAASGARTWTGYSGPYGETASSDQASNTATTGTSLGWHGQQQRLTDRNLVHMGARPYLPSHGRFLSVDPLEGGCANDYTYVSGDPVNSDDLVGRGCPEWLDNLADSFSYGGLIAAANDAAHFRFKDAAGRVWDYYVFTYTRKTASRGILGNLSMLAKQAGRLASRAVSVAAPYIGVGATILDAACNLATRFGDHDNPVIGPP